MYSLLILVLVLIICLIIFFVSKSDLSKKEFFVIQEKIESKTTIKKRMKIKLFIFFILFFVNIMLILFLFFYKYDFISILFYSSIPIILTIFLLADIVGDNIKIKDDKERIFWDKIIYIILMLVLFFSFSIDFLF